MENTCLRYSSHPIRLQDSLGIIKDPLVCQRICATKGPFFTKALYFEMGHVSPQCLSLGAFVSKGGSLGLVSPFCL